MSGRNNIRTLALLTSENHRSARTKDDGNDRMKDLEKTLKQGYFAWFPVKDGFIIYNVSLEDSLYLGRKYGQKAVIFIDGASCQYWEQDGKGKLTATNKENMSQRLDMNNAADSFTQISCFSNIKMHSLTEAKRMRKGFRK